jgi:23S rRNA (adenine-N6)-dimethyltransferase
MVHLPCPDADRGVRWERLGHNTSSATRPPPRRSWKSLAWTPADFVLEFGAGHGRLTEQLALRAGRVVAVEINARLAAQLTRRFRARPNVTVVLADALAVSLPRRQFKVVSNPPFHITSALLHRLLDDPVVPLVRADLVLGWGSALGLTGVFGPAQKARPWLSRYEFLLIRRLSRELFDPPPAQDAAMISIRRRFLPRARW